MSEWDFDEGTAASKKAQGFQSGNWDGLLTAVAFLAVAAVSFFMAWITRSIPSRPFWLLGLLFAAPVAALMLSVFLKEKATSSMTPNTSRNAQLVLVLCSILAAFLVGCFCEISNEKADTYEEVVTGEGWSDLVIVLDKSGSMLSTVNGETFDHKASSAVVDFISELDDETRVGLLIDVGWEENNSGSYVIPLKDRIVPVAPLTPEQREKLNRMAKCETGNNENFVRAFETAFDMIDQVENEGRTFSILFITDGEDSTHSFHAQDFVEKYKQKGIIVNYMHVIPDTVDEVQKLADLTGGKGVYVTEKQALLDQMQQMARIPIITVVFKDALRNIDESVQAKLVTGILLLLLGILIGLSLTVMLSVQGQKRFQIILSPLMAVLAFVLLAFGKGLIPEAWIREGVAFSLLGIVLMRANRATGTPAGTGRW